MGMILQMKDDLQRIRPIGLGMETCPDNQVFYLLMLTFKLYLCVLERFHC